ncbi:uncharacterized protein LOC131336381 [Rhododendron vialii]|uniref:uncharacterized protein LOC131336381 n=1 Tax=Rhododendron vialii TaxID=182163 RepID=UPI00265D6B3E|nr:uncharacterized protein LOC131336381 [Rhododendron vialii]
MVFGVSEHVLQLSSKCLMKCTNYNSLMLSLIFFYNYFPKSSAESAPHFKPILPKSYEFEICRLKLSNEARTKILPEGLQTQFGLIWKLGVDCGTNAAMHTNLNIVEVAM